MKLCHGEARAGALLSILLTDLHPHAQLPHCYYLRSLLLNFTWLRSVFTWVDPDVLIKRSGPLWLVRPSLATM